jgi:hypothetical protein
VSGKQSTVVLLQGGHGKCCFLTFGNGKQQEKTLQVFILVMPMVQAFTATPAVHG